MKHIFAFLITGFSILLFGQNTATVSEGMFQIDQEAQMIVANENLESINNQLESGNFSKIYLDKEYLLEADVAEFEYGIIYAITGVESLDSYFLHFTPLPLISITTDYTIVDEPRVPAHFHMSESDGNLTSEFIGIEYRGASSQMYPKKSLRIEFVTEEGGDEEKNVPLLGMRDDGDWNIQAMFNEPLRLNNMVSFEIWDEINTLYYLEEEDRAINGVRMEYVEVFLKGQYMGVYGLGERVDRKQLRLKKVKDGEKRGELLKGKHWDYATLFQSVPDYNNEEDYWAGYEVKHPKPNEMIDWEDFYNFYLFILESDDEEFYEEYENRLVSDNLADYYIFLNLIKADDNTGKNLFFAKYSTDEPYFIVPWDLDGTFGVFWDGSLTGTVNSTLSNTLFERLKADCSQGGFTEKVLNKWNSLREDVVTIEHIFAKFQSRIDLLTQNGVYKREFNRWHDNPWFNFPEGDPTEYIIGHTDYFYNWTVDRLDFLDSYFPTLCDTAGTVENSKTQLMLYPNPVADDLIIDSEKNERFKLFNLSGQKVMEGKLNIGKNTIDFSRFAPGIYLIKTENGAIGKIIKN